MRSLLSTLAFLCAFALTAQVPQAFDFQGIARDASGNVLSGQSIALRISIHSASANGPVAYEEVHAVSTSAFGLFNVQVGSGAVTVGSFAAIGWRSAAHFIQVEMDAAGGNAYVDMGTTQLLSVPYALHAGSTDCMTVSLLGDTLRQGNGCHVIIPGISAANGGCLDVDGDGFYHIAGCGPVDCDDTHADTYPGAVEICGDGRDNDCDGAVDNNPDTNAHVTWYQDADGDGYGSASSSTVACAQPVGFANNDGDCDDADPARFPGQGCSVVCTNVEQDWIDQNMEFYLNTVSAIWLNCFITGNAAGCMIGDLAQYEQSGEIPLSAQCHSCAVAYMDCVASTCLAQCVGDPNSAACLSCLNTSCRPDFLACAGLVDADGDGWSSGSDCNDADATIHPGAAEVCDGIDNNCDGLTDDEDPNAAGPFPFLLDLDGDGFGNPFPVIYRCSSTAPAGMVPDLGGINDCNDSDPTIFPGAQEICDDWDNDCDEINNEDGALGAVQWFLDGDGDEYGTDTDVVLACSPPVGYVADGGDCDDTNADIHPGALEDCFDGIDNDCDGIVDEVQNIWYQDLDNDGFGNDAMSETACTPSSGYIQAGGDCDDTDPDIHPGATEICGNGVDDDCDGLVDENAVIRYRDADGDGFGTDLDVILACGPVSGYVNNSADCDDGNPDVNPGMIEICDGLDNNCDGEVDNGLCNIDGVCYEHGASAPGTPCLVCDTNFSLTEWTPAPQSTVCGSSACSFSICDGLGNCQTIFHPASTACDDGDPNTINDSCDGAGNCTGTFVTPETCNGIDDDGDGLTDAADPGLVLVPCENQNGVCNGVMKTANLCVGGTWLTCSTSEYQIGSPVFEIPETSCDGQDNNCDGQVDEGGICGCAPAGTPCNDGNACTVGETEDGACNCGGGVMAPAGTACDDGNPNTTNDVCNGAGVCSGTPCPDADADGFTTCGGDCDDSDPDVHPGAIEVCNGIDDNCDGGIDEGFDLGAPCGCGGVVVCNGSGGSTCSVSTVEICGDGLDNDCDGEFDEGCSCLDNDVDGFTNCDGDCDDNNPDVYPGAVEVCGDGLDNDCNGTVDDATIWYEDADGDGFGVATSTLSACEAPEGYVFLGTDCDDQDPAVYPLAGPGIGCASATEDDRLWLADNYLGLWNLSGIAMANCNSGSAQAQWDCLISFIRPQVPLSSGGLQCALERAYCAVSSCNGECIPFLLGSNTVLAGTPACNTCMILQGCNANFAACMGIVDQDGDGIPDFDDCNDANATVYPGAPEICGDGIDNNCDGQVDEGC